jgi:hypothetical protein
VLYRLRLLCEQAHEQDAELALHRGAEEHSLVLQTMRTEKNEETETVLLQAVLESHARDNAAMQELASELRQLAWVESVDVTGTDPEAE